MEEKIKEILMDTLEYCDCDTCEYADGVSECYSCYRKNCNWHLSEEVAKNISRSILTYVTDKLREYVVDELMKDIK